MKKKILVLQFRTDQSLKHEQDCFKKALSKKYSLFFLNVFGESFKAPSKRQLLNYSLVIVSGSGQYDLTNLPKDKEFRINKIKPFIKHLVAIDFPTLGICFGHQLICATMDAKVKKDKANSESGTYKVYLRAKGKESKLYNNLAKSFYAIEGHKDSIVTKPKGGVLLASTRRNRYHSFQFGNNVFTTQFHPELDKRAVEFRFTLYPEYLKNNSLETLMKKFKETKETKKLFSNIV